MISIIIPTYNEAALIEGLVNFAFKHGGAGIAEIIVSDGGSTDETLNIAKRAGAKGLLSPARGRAAQMNFGARHATGDTLYFVHADTKLHPAFAKDIPDCLRKGYDLGCYRYRFDSSKLLLKINAFATRLPFIWCRGGDQTLFIRHSVFQSLNGFANMMIMEDYDIIQRALKQQYRFKIIPKNVMVSSRKYESNSYFKVLRANYRIMKLWKQGQSSDIEMHALYKKLLQ